MTPYPPVTLAPQREPTSTDSGMLDEVLGHPVLELAWREPTKTDSGRRWLPQALRRLMLAELSAALLIFYPAGAQAEDGPGWNRSGHSIEPGALQARPDRATCGIRLMVLYASRSKKPGHKPQVDPRIGHLPELEKEPFSLYDRWELVSRHDLVLLDRVPKSQDLPDGSVLRITLLEAQPGKGYRISASITRPGGKDLLPLLEVKARPGQVFMVAGQSYRQGKLVLVLRVEQR